MVLLRARPVRQSYFRALKSALEHAESMSFPVDVADRARCSPMRLFPRPISDIFCTLFFRNGRYRLREPTDLCMKLSTRLSCICMPCSLDVVKVYQASGLHQCIMVTCCRLRLSHGCLLPTSQGSP